jgi:hypothetical protein
MPFGTVQADVIGTSVAGSNIGAGNASIMKNRIINGAMVVQQRGNSPLTIDTTTANNYCLDRWTCEVSQASKFTVTQSSTAPAGFNNSALITSSSAYSVGAGDYFVFEQRIEGYNFADLNWGTANAKTITLSFWVRSSLTGTFGGSFRNSAADRSYPFTYTISAANTWEYETITIVGDTSGTWLTTNGTGLQLTLNLGTGSTYSGTAGAWAGANYVSATGATSVVGTNGATFYITGVQLEVGSSATGFEYRQYQQELALCQRYYSKIVSGGLFGAVGIGYTNGATTGACYIKYPITLRAIPTATFSNLLIAPPGTSYAITAIDVSQAGTDVCNLSITTAGGMTSGQPAAILGGNSATAFIAFSAEL